MLKTEVDEPAKTIIFESEQDLKKFATNFPTISALIVDFSMEEQNVET